MGTRWLDADEARGRRSKRFALAPMKKAAGLATGGFFRIWW
jgi:hypothetical protein